MCIENSECPNRDNIFIEIKTLQKLKPLRDEIKMFGAKKFFLNFLIYVKLLHFSVEG